jgi:hypothetical protein
VNGFTAECQDNRQKSISILAAGLALFKNGVFWVTNAAQIKPGYY